jgi:hypothetical protein
MTERKQVHLVVCFDPTNRDDLWKIDYESTNERFGGRNVWDPNIQEWVQDDENEALESLRNLLWPEDPIIEPTLVCYYHEGRVPESQASDADFLTGEGGSICNACKEGLLNYAATSIRKS